ncbi:DNA translocase FtsK-like [Diorhabda sublineata]|uniref:DNA translocase FtsK-like n=1 Tax=Diorhabda sublineata TaxID=1163346 RepID=UPI0024E11EFA|nr:DNA translocase FtsK-like [Diorhabda sublineata]
MLRFVIFLALITTILSQGYHGDSRTAAILAEDRYLQADGRFGAQYQQEDGVNFKEVSSPDGTRQGSYSYVDPNGQRHTITYTAGKDGFMASGDGIPQPVPTTLPVAPTPGYQPLPQYNPPEYSRPQSQYQPRSQYQQPQPQYQPQSQYQQPQPQYQPQSQYQQPQPQYQPQYQQPQPQYRPQPQYEPTTPSPHRFYPPGKLSLNRSPDGFQFSFKKS